MEPLFTLPAVAGLIAAYLGRAWSGGALVAAAVLTKPQGMLVGPAFALVLWQTGGLASIARAGTALVGTVLLAVLPFAARGALANMWLAFGSFYERRDTMSAFAANIGDYQLGAAELVEPQRGWAAFLVGAGPLAISRFRELGYPNPRPIGTTLVLVTVGWACGSRGTQGPFPARHARCVYRAPSSCSTSARTKITSCSVPLLVLAAALRRRFRPPSSP